MSRLNLSRIALLSLLMVMVALALPLTTLAAQPTIMVTNVNDTFVDEFVSDFCGFPVEFHVEGTIRTIFWDDPGGPAVYKQIDVFPGWVKTWTNLNTGTSVTTRGPSARHLTVNADGSFTVEITGLTIGFHQPGEGIVYLNTGHLTIFFDSPDDEEPDVTHTPPSGDDLAVICTLLG